MEKLVSNATDSLQQNRAHTCADIDECGVFSLNNCTQGCVNAKGSYRCGCAVGFADSRGDGSVCEAVGGEETVVLLAYGGEIRQMRENGMGYVYSALIENEEFVLAMDVDPVDR